MVDCWGIASILDRQEGRTYGRPCQVKFRSSLSLPIKWSPWSPRSGVSMLGSILRGSSPLCLHTSQAEGQLRTRSPCGFPLDVRVSSRRQGRVRQCGERGPKHSLGVSACHLGMFYLCYPLSSRNTSVYKYPLSWDFTHAGDAIAFVSTIH